MKNKQDSKKLCFIGWCGIFIILLFALIIN